MKEKLKINNLNSRIIIQTLILNKIMTIYKLYITFICTLYNLNMYIMLQLQMFQSINHFIIMVKLLQVLRFMPPMCITKDDVDFTIAVLRRAIQNYYEAKYRNNL